jgi:hypothetical protein
VDGLSYGSLAVSDSDLILSGFEDSDGSVVYGCDKAHCDRGLQRLPQTIPFSSLQVYGDRLAGARGQPLQDLRSFGTYELPRLADEKIVIHDLPGPTRPRFHGGFVYWTLPIEEGVYRCALPDCPEGPERLGRGRGDVVIAGEYAFWTAGLTAVYRAHLPGPESPEALLLDDTLGSVGSISSASAEGRQLLAGSESHLYAASLEQPAAMGDSAPSRIFRWPAGGGPRELVVEAEEEIDGIFAFGDELVWTTRHGTGGRLFSCVASSCDETTRPLGLVGFQSRAVAADETHLYWLAAVPDPSPQHAGEIVARTRAVRRVALIASRD